MHNAIKGVCAVAIVLLSFMLGYAMGQHSQPNDPVITEVKMWPLPPKAMERAVLHIDPGWEPFGVTQTHILLRR